MASIRELHQQLIRKERSAVEIRNLKPHYAVRAKVAHFCVTADSLSQARQWMPKSQLGRNRFWLGFIGIKDNMCTQGILQPAPHACWRTLCRHMNQP